MGRLNGRRKRRADLVGLHEPTEGAIYYDGHDLQELNLQDVRRQFGVVLQGSALFSGSILSNLTLTDPGIDLEPMTEAARIAALHDDVVAMRWATRRSCPEGGSALSGGQRQRLAIARAVPRRPKILLFDEATSHLDIETERRVPKTSRRSPARRSSSRTA